MTVVYGGPISAMESYALNKGDYVNLDIMASPKNAS